MKNIFFILFTIFILGLGYAYFNKSGFVTTPGNTKLNDAKTNFLTAISSLPDRGPAPDIVGIQGWINSTPLSKEDLKGKVILVDFWTYSCINCIRTLPYLKEWYAKYKHNRFLIIGVHSPEFDFEKNKDNVLAAVKKYGLDYPIALDNNHATWDAFSNQYWPAHYLIDAKGHTRYLNLGEGRYTETESAIQQLLLEAGLLTLDKVIEPKETLPGADFSSIETPEIYLGYSRISNFGSDAKDVRPNRPYDFPEPKNIEDNKFYFSGKWKIQAEFAESAGENSKIIIRYKANKVNMVLGLGVESPIKLEIKLDGKYLTKNNKGADIFLENGKSYLKIDSPRLYNFSNTGSDYNRRTLEINVPSQGLRAFTFTFG